MCIKDIGFFFLQLPEKGDSRPIKPWPVNNFAKVLNFGKAGYVWKG